METQRTVTERAVKDLPHPIVRRRGHRRASSQRGRLLLLLIFLLLRVSDLLIYFATPAANKTQLLGPIITGGIWTTAFLIAIGYRKNWARYILSVLMILSVIASSMFAVTLLQEELPDRRAIAILFISTVITGGAFLCLISSANIRRLTHRV